MNGDFLRSVYNNPVMAGLDDIRNMAEELMDAQEKLDAKPAKFEVKMDDQGNIIIPISDYLREVAPEVKEELAKDDYWAFPLWDQIVETISDEYANDTYNVSIDKIRTRLLTSRHMPELVRRWAEGKMSQVNYAEQKAKWYMDWAFALWRWSDKFSILERKDMPKQDQYKSSYVKQAVIDACVAEFNALGATFPAPSEDADV